MQPELALAYASNGGDGILGVGWDIVGLSAITRCPQTFAQDGGVRPVVFDADDRFCLDGNRLRLVGGTHATDGADYRTEILNFMRVQAVGQDGTGTGPHSFVAKNRDGMTFEYGGVS
jgi:hypothetical protein